MEAKGHIQSKLETIVSHGLNQFSHKTKDHQTTHHVARAPRFSGGRERQVFSLILSDTAVQGM